MNDYSGNYASQRLSAAYMVEMASDTPNDHKARELRDAICVLRGRTDLRLELRAERMANHDPGDEDRS